MGDNTMKNRISLYTEPEKAAISSFLSALILLVLMFVFILSVNYDADELNSLLRSDYSYSAIMQNSVHENDYYQFNASIEFALSIDDMIGLNADVLMQTQDTEYTEIVCWNADLLNKKGIAVSKNLAKSNGLGIGDKLYSKNVVNGEICGYTIEQIIPEAFSVGSEKITVRKDGMIIMGFDEQYAENISHNSIVFTDKPIGSLSEIGMPENIIYREDKIAASMCRIAPYLFAVGAASAFLMIALVVLLTNYARENFKRLMILGFEKRKLNAAYCRLVICTGLVTAAGSFVLSCTALLFVGFSMLKMLMMIFMLIIELVALIAASYISNIRLWRK